MYGKPTERPLRHLAYSVILAIVVSCSHTLQQDTAEELINLAGNTEDELLRLNTLKNLLDTPGLNPELKADLTKFIPCIDRWNYAEDMRYFRPDKEFRITISLESLLYPLLCFYQGRQLVQYRLEPGPSPGGWDDIDKARRLFRTAEKAFPKNRIIGMYLGKPIPVDKEYAAHPRAPTWANLQREGLERLADVMEWWIDHRQQPDGQLRGGWGDDVELWRVWYSVVIPFADPKLIESQTRLSRGLWNQPYMAGGYTDKLTDVEHAAEDSGDTLSPMVLLEPDNPEWVSRTLKIANLMKTLWSDRNDRGFLQFKSVYFNASEVQMRESCDTFYHSRVLHPAFLLWLRTGDKELGSLLTDWMRTWVDAASRTEYGKPAGVLPSAVFWPSGRVGCSRPDWWNPVNYTEEDTNYFTFPSQLSQMARCLALTYQMTGDEEFVEPLSSMARILLKYPEPDKAATPGSEEWCAANMEGILPALAKYRLLSGAKEFDSLLLRESDPIITHRLRGDSGPILEALRNNVEFLRSNFEAYTGELRFTDRLFSYPEMYGPWDADTEDRRATVRQFNPSIFYQVATGDPGDLLYYPLMAVRWLTPPREIAAFVTESSRSSLTADLFHFGDQPRNLGAELYLLEPGTYEMTLIGIDGDQETELKKQTLTVKGPRERIQFQLPEQTLCRVTVRQLAR